MLKLEAHDTTTHETVFPHYLTDRILIKSLLTPLVSFALNMLAHCLVTSASVHSEAGHATTCLASVELLHGAVTFLIYAG